MAYLVITVPGKDPYRHELTHASTIGRGVECEICLRDALLSRRHCRIEPIDAKRGAWQIVDLKSRNGTRVGKNYVACRALEDDATIQIGQTSIQFHAAGFVSTRPSNPGEAAPHVPLDHLLAPLPARDTTHC